MDYSKYENRKKYPSLSEEKAYKMTLEGQVYKLTATVEELIEHFKEKEENHG